MTTATATPTIEIVPAGEALAEERRGKGTWTAHYDVVCSRCGPVKSNVMYPTACSAKNDHLCRPRSGRRG